MVQKQRPPSEWLVTEREDLRIIPVELQGRVQKRLTEIASDKDSKSNFGNRGNATKHLFVGAMKCSECGGNFIVISGKGRGYLGCWNAHRATTTACANKRTVQMAWTEFHLIEELRKHLDSAKTYAQIAKRYNEIMATKHASVPRRLKQIEELIAERSREVENLTRFVAGGNLSDAVVGALTKAEESLKNLTTERNFLAPQISHRVYVTPQAVREKMIPLDEILGQRKAESNRVLKSMFPDKITMTPDPQNARGYIARGGLNLYAIIKFKKYVNGVPKGI